MAKNKPRSLAGDIFDAIRAGTKKWNKTRKAEERRPTMRRYRHARMTMERGPTFKEAAAEIMEEAYLEVSDNNALPAEARQIMYKARPYIQEKTDREDMTDAYFIQTLLRGYMRDNPEKCADWDVVFSARGHFKEPHDGKVIGLGTLEVRKYLAEMDDPEVEDASLSDAKVKTSGPKGSFGAVLFIEKEGFEPLMKAAQIADKYDIAIMSTKGMSVTAARKLADQMCYEHDIPLLLLRDFDKTGFSISGSFQRDNETYEFENAITVIELGLSLKDVEAMELASEYQHHKKGSEAALVANMRDNGATDEEVAFMFRDFNKASSFHCTRRVELNAMTSRQFITYVEDKLKKLVKDGVLKKIVPDQKLLAEAYASAIRSRHLAEAFDEAVEDLDDQIDKADLKAPKDLEQRVRALLKRHPTLRWDEALAEIINPPPKKSKNKGAVSEVSPLDNLPKPMRNLVEKVLTDDVMAPKDLRRRARALVKRHPILRAALAEIIARPKGRRR
jgi:hypothetical protein